MMGGVVHFEIPADDQKRARKFYQEALGWRIEAVPGMDYSMVITTDMDDDGQPAAAGAINGGMMARDGRITAPVITVDVPDINATLKSVEQLGGSVVMPKNEIPGMGYTAYFKDPEGNVMGLWENLPGAGPGAGS
ncbi:VOC family protein [Arthrobacter sp. SLBN-83]|uniref:VOC family protein n=1 Tax=Arthrobacter sp. SLBN-83 TaxID=2768449 RepID=UPI00114EED16|nr:VOC family protein [Arthrobacter sp. SLBN-83]